MAKETLTHLTDDLDGTDAVAEITFAVRGTEYEIDLNAKNLAAFDKALEKFIKRARPVHQTRVARGPRGAGRSRSKTSGRRENVSEIRDWARAAGLEVSNRGRISASIREAYEAAQS